MLTKKKSKVFLDSSVFIAAAISSTGHARTVMLRALHGQETLVVSSLVLEETRRNLSRKAPKALNAFDLFREALPIKLVDPPLSLVTACLEVVHVKDAPIIAAAYAAKVDWIVSYDHKHLLSQRDTIVRHFGIQVGTPDDYLREQVKENN